jgi:hypothetical protein
MSLLIFHLFGLNISCYTVYKQQRQTNKKKPTTKEWKHIKLFQSETNKYIMIYILKKRSKFVQKIPIRKGICQTVEM